MAFLGQISNSRSKSEIFCSIWKLSFDNGCRSQSTLFRKTAVYMQRYLFGLGVNHYIL